MSLRARLALLYTSIVGGILFIFGTVVYVSVSLTLTRQVDRALVETANQIIIAARVGALGGIETQNWDLFKEVYVQMWGRDDQLLMESRNIRGFDQPLDPAGLYVGNPVYHNVTRANTRLRALTVPLVVKDTDRIVARLQVATGMDTVNATQTVLSWVLIIGTGISMAIAGLAGWFSTNQALAPLDAVTQTALQITRADDLSRRIPYRGPADDEVGQLIHAFNQTLSRLENLFNAQRRFITDVGHELRTPLTVIKGNVDLMRRMNCTEEELVNNVDDEVDRLTRLVGDLLLLAQAESGRLPLVQSTVELDTLVLDVLSQMSVLAKDRLSLRLGEIDQVLVCGDKDRLKQVLVNLIGNAIKYTPRGGEVIIGVAKEAGSWACNRE